MTASLPYIDATRAPHGRLRSALRCDDREPDCLALLSGTAGNPGNYYLQSLDFDATTGNLSGLVRDASCWQHGACAELESQRNSPFRLPLNGYPTDGTNYGMDLAVFTAVPEPSSFALIGFGLATLAVFGRQRSRRTSQRP